MKTFFVVPYFNETLMQSVAICDEKEAKRIFDEANSDMPHEFYMHNSETKMVYKWNFPGWKECFRAYVAVRKNIDTNYPETIICNDGIFDTIKDAEEYVAKNGGRWKIYCFSELRLKLHEDFELRERLKGCRIASIQSKTTIVKRAN